MNIIIKKITPADLNLFYPFFAKTLSNNFPYYHPKVINYFLNKIYTFSNLSFWLTNGDREILAAFLDNEPIGFAMIDSPYGGVSFLRWLAVDKNYQKKGIGSKLVLEWEKIAKESGCQKMELATHQTTVPFYQKQGFQIEGLRKLSYFGINQVLMGKIIGKFNPDRL